MIGFLRGEVLEHGDGKVVLLVAGVGYQVTVPSSPAYLSVSPGKQADLHIHTHVREDALDLFGFSTKMEKELFLTLLSVNGIGPKVAMGILSRVEPEQLVRAVIEGDTASLTEIPGIGKKTAERVVLELGDKMRKKQEAGALAAPKGARTRVAAGPASSIVRDAREALVGLGYREQDVSQLLQRMLSERETPPQHAEELVKSALRELL